MNENIFEYTSIAGEAIKELERATQMNGPFSSAHEGWAVMKEEFDELWKEIKKKHSERDKEKMHTEAIQVAAMAMRFVHDICK